MTYCRLILVPIFLCASAGSLRCVLAQDELVEIITGLLKEQDKDLRALAFDQIRKEAKGEATTRKLAELLPEFAAETQVGLLSALADRGDSAAAPAIRKLLAATQDESVRIAALKALGPLGGNDDLGILVESLSAKSPTLRDAARASLVRLPNESTDAMVAQMKQSSPATHVMLLHILTTRRARDAVPALFESAADDDAAVRQAAVSALAELAGVEHLPGMTSLVLRAAPGRERDSIEKATAAVCLRAEDGHDRAAPLINITQDLKKEDQLVMLPTLGRVGGAAALAVVDEAVQSPDPAFQIAGIRALCNWPDGTVVTRLLRVARTDDDATQRKLAFQTLIRVAPLADERTDGRRLDTLRTVFAMCSSDAERNQVLDRAKAIRSIDTLHFLIPFLAQPAFTQQTCLTVVELAHHSGLRESHKEEFHRALDRVLKISKDATVIDRAQRYKTGQTWLRPKTSN